MADAPESIRRFFADWTQYRSRLVEAVRDLTADQLAISAGPDHAPIWAPAAHCAGTRIHWLCGEISQQLGVNGLPAIDLWSRRTI